MDLKETLEELRRKHELPALGAVALREGAPQGVAVVGKRRVGGLELARADDAFHLGSNTKAMTAALIGTFIDQGKLSTKSTLGELLPETPSAWRATTLEALLTHRAGLKRTEPQGKTLLALHRLRGPRESQRLQWLTERLATPPDETVGTYAYSNAGYTILGIIAERLGKAPWETLVQERIWKPLGIQGGGFGAPPLLWQHVHEEKRSVGLDPREKVDNPPLMGPAGAVHLPLGEWAKFVEVFANPERQSLLQPATLAWLTSPRLGGTYNGGWILTSRSWSGGPALTHAGSNTFNYCVAWVAPQRRFAALVATNSAGEGATKACDAAVGVLIASVLKPAS